MSSICSRHVVYDPDCQLCNTDIREVLPDYDQMVREAEAAGEVECGACGFCFYRTTPTCPLCSGWTWQDGGHCVTWPFHTVGHKGYGNEEWIGRFEYVRTE